MLISSDFDPVQFREELEDEVMEAARNAVSEEGVSIECPNCGSTITVYPGTNVCQNCGEENNVNLNF